MSQPSGVLLSDAGLPLGGLRPSSHENRASSRGRPGPLGPAPTLPVSPCGRIFGHRQRLQGLLSARSANLRATWAGQAWESDSTGRRGWRSRGLVSTIR